MRPPLAISDSLISHGSSPEIEDGLLLDKRRLEHQHKVVILEAILVDLQEVQAVSRVEPSAVDPSEARPLEAGAEQERE